jgi:hypothetical protein
MILVGHVACIGQIRASYRILMGIVVGKIIAGI